MARLSARRRASKAKAGNGAIIAANFLTDTPRSVKAERLALRVAEGWKQANATAQPPQGAVFTAKNPSLPVFVDTSNTDFDVNGLSNLRPIVGYVPRVKRFKRFARS